MRTFNEKVGKLCNKIPKGRVSTYKEIAHALNTKSYRAVGQALKKNKRPNSILCYKVIKSNGSIGGYSGSHPENIQKKIRKLRSDGIMVKNNKIDLQKYLFRFNSRQIISKK